MCNGSAQRLDALPCSFRLTVFRLLPSARYHTLASLVRLSHASPRTTHALLRLSHAHPMLRFFVCPTQAHAQPMLCFVCPTHIPCFASSSVPRKRTHNPCFASSPVPLKPMHIPCFSSPNLLAALTIALPAACRFSIALARDFCLS